MSVGNLPPGASVLIKITYVAELQVDGEKICFFIPSNVAPWSKRKAFGDVTQASTCLWVCTGHDIGISLI